MAVIIKSASELALMRRAGGVVAATLAALAQYVRPGITTAELDQLAEATIRSLGGIPSFKGYRGFPASLCVSVNEEVVHGIPGRRVLREGEIVSLDVGAIYQGLQGDAAITVPVGRVSAQMQNLMRVTQAALMAGIEAARAGNRLGDVSAAIQRVAEAAGYSVVREYGGHGVGRAMHEDPHIPNWGEPGTGMLLKPGMTIALEPMVNAGKHQVRVKADNWTVVTVDGLPSAHFEHTIAITEGEPEIMTVER
jgi:methionyl aminopeptidase